MCCRKIPIKLTSEPWNKKDSFLFQDLNNYGVVLVIDVKIYK